MDDKIKDGFEGTGLSDSEKAWGVTRFAEYRKAFPHLNKQGNLYLLEELVWRECIQERFKIQVGELKKNAVTAMAPLSKDLTTSINDGLSQITEMKTKLGMFEEQKTLDSFKYIQETKEKFAAYRLAHPLVFKCTCPKCAFSFGIKRRMEHFEEFVSPFLESKILNNDPLFKLYKQGKITKDDVANVLGVSPKYVDWLDKKVYGNVISTDAPKINDVPPEPTAPETPAEPPLNEPTA